MDDGSGDVCLPVVGLFVRSVEVLRWSNVDGRFPGPSLDGGVAAPTLDRALDNDAGKARRPADSDGEYSRDDVALNVEEDAVDDDVVGIEDDDVDGVLRGVRRVAYTDSDDDEAG